MFPIQPIKSKNTLYHPSESPETQNLAQFLNATDIYHKRYTHIQGSAKKTNHGTTDHLINPSGHHLPTWTTISPWRSPALLSSYRDCRMHCMQSDAHLLSCHILTSARTPSVAPIRPVSIGCSWLAGRRVSVEFASVGDSWFRWEKAGRVEDCYSLIASGDVAVPLLAPTNRLRHVAPRWWWFRTFGA